MHRLPAKPEKKKEEKKKKEEEEKKKQEEEEKRRRRRSPSGALASWQLKQHCKLQLHQCQLQLQLHLAS